jgi:hypothetical protein
LTPDPQAFNKELDPAIRAPAAKVLLIKTRLSIMAEHLLAEHLTGSCPTTTLPSLGGLRLLEPTARGGGDKGEGEGFHRLADNLLKML